MFAKPSLGIGCLIITDELSQELDSVSGPASSPLFTFPVSADLCFSHSWNCVSVVDGLPVVSLLCVYSFSFQYLQFKGLCLSN